MNYFKLFETKMQNIFDQKCIINISSFFSEPGKKSPMLLNPQWKSSVNQQLMKHESLTVDYVKENFSVKQMEILLGYNLVDFENKQGKN